MKLISFIIPTYNRADRIEKAVESIIEQTHSSWELLIIDDGSTDNTREVVSDFCFDERIQFYSRNHSGVSSSRNFGAKIAKGDYLVFLDSDDFLYQDLVKEIFTSNINKPFLCWEVVKVVGEKRISWKPENLGKVYNYITASFLAGSFCISKDLFFKIGGYDENLDYGENYELGLRISTCIDESHIFQKPFLQNNVRPERNSHNSRERLYACLYQYKKHKSRIVEDSVFESNLNYLMGYLLERLNKRSFSKKLYKRAWKINPFNFKAFLKSLYLTLR
ncbi:glycosyltransferase family 2 protein [Gramella lutea]|uniref:Glycosyltransferase family 2 protein n=1 Tax=Christiangramia lutea TaxID=1607951 RepID=A0A9X2A9Y5_9FLAO|nr:glycosyltransferase family A protein [Christiangramia lutea]MCH4823810.1 glycosyltransferase family 2 protein [Christiangramia lutea]